MPGLFSQIYTLLESHSDFSSQNNYYYFFLCSLDSKDQPIISSSSI